MTDLSSLSLLSSFLKRFFIIRVNPCNPWISPCHPWTCLNPCNPWISPCHPWTHHGSALVAASLHCALYCVNSNPKEILLRWKFFTSVIRSFSSEETVLF